MQTPIDFAAYKGKLKFAASSVDSLEKVYSTTKLPQYNATLSSLETQRRAALMEMVKSTVDAARDELNQLNNQLVAAQGNQFTRETSVKQTFERFPVIGKEIEEEVKKHEWLKDT